MGLVDEFVYDTSEQDRLDALATVREGSFSPILLRAFGEVADVLPDADRRLGARGGRRAARGSSPCTPTRAPC